MAFDQVHMAEYNGHLYAIVAVGPETWQTARDHAQTLESGQTDWHLATLSDAAENAVLVGLLHSMGSGAAWFGLHQQPGSVEPTGGWIWDNGDVETYRNWNRSEPNNLGGEDSGEIYATGTWNDLPNFYSLGYALYELDTSRALDLTGSASADVMLGGLLGDSLAGGDGADILRGKDGADWLFGGTGDDQIRGGAGQDNLEGSLGADTFLFGRCQASGPLAGDLITDFAPGIDHIDLSAIDADRHSATDDSFTFLGSDPFTQHAGELRYLTTAGGVTNVLADVNGDGKADFALLLNGSLILDDASFVL